MTNNTNHTTRLPPAGGFTVVELIVTITIVGILAAVVGPRFFDLGVFQESGFYDQTVSAVRYAQKLAVATECTVRVQITTTGFTIYRAANVSGCKTGPYTTPVNDPTANGTFTRTAPSGVTLTPADFTFASDGSASAGPTISVGSRSFNVVAATGFVQTPPPP